MVDVVGPVLSFSGNALPVLPGEVGSSIRNPCRKVAGLDRCVDKECNARLPSTCIGSSL